MKRSKKCFNLVELDYDLESKRVRINEFSAEFSQLSFSADLAEGSPDCVADVDHAYLTLVASRQTSLEGNMRQKKQENSLKRSFHAVGSVDSLQEDSDCATTATHTTNATSFGTLSLSHGSLQRTEGDDSEGDDLGKAQFEEQFPEEGALSDSEFSAGVVF
ncbi:hypothetical protein EON65_30800 [archaeon]|nr:MAG: hypothetical protein EON65_30800 [archaeon]